MTHDRRHPSKADLLQHVEGHVDSSVRISAHIASHVASCPRCRREAEGMVESLLFVKKAPAIEVRKTLTATILLAAKNERRVAAAQEKRYAGLMKVSKRFAVAAVALLILNVAYTSDRSRTSARGASLQAGVVDASIPAARTEAAPAPLSWVRMDDARLLRTVVMSPERWISTSGHSRNTDQKYKMKVEYLEDAISEAMQELSLNPGLRRANRLVAEGNQRLYEELKMAYVERPL